MFLQLVSFWTFFVFPFIRDSPFSFPKLEQISLNLVNNTGTWSLWRLHTPSNFIQRLKTWTIV